MRLLGILVLSLSILFSCAPAYTTAETAEIQEYAAEIAEETILPAVTEQETAVSEKADTADPPADAGDSASPDIRYLLFLQDFRSSIHDAWTPFMESV